MEDYPLMRELFQIRSALERIETKLGEKPRGFADDKGFLILAAVGVALLLPESKQQAVMALLLK